MYDMFSNAGLGFDSLLGAQDPMMLQQQAMQLGLTPDDFKLLGVGQTAPSLGIPNSAPLVPAPNPQLPETKYSFEPAKDAAKGDGRLTVEQMMMLQKMMPSAVAQTQPAAGPVGRSPQVSFTPMQLQAQQGQQRKAPSLADYLYRR